MNRLYDKLHEAVKLCELRSQRMLNAYCRIEGIKKLFPHTKVEITIQPADETEYILSNPEYARVLEERIANYYSRQVSK